MKKFLVVFFAMLLVACGNQDNEDNTNSEQKSQESSTETPSDENVSVKFRNLDITTPEKQIAVKGQAAATNDVFYFKLLYGEEVAVDESEVKLDTNASGWGSFELKIDIPKNDQTKDQIPVLTFYVKDESGKMVNPNYVPVDLAQ
ncbi:hypothetical protein [Virgibacillus oceani]|uniref:Bacterial spore germination immunoglobulin-like domain-containing protein n=1 Tax=Virgibacillus oceani TaxID=1479511 RepID=A0A917HE12_9BACI|nr:hypothetical protein [Virgibacillus oceani]GGG75380.1 hypothetical protein GCM10011398_20230 [Virgibacillus oceani]